MSIFAKFGKNDPKCEPQRLADCDVATAPAHVDAIRDSENELTRRTGRTHVYAVRVRESFKGSILSLVAEIQLERQKRDNKSRRVTEGEVIEMMLDVFKTARRTGVTNDNTVPLPSDVWNGVHQIARRLQVAPADIVERLVVQKVAELGLMPRK